MEVFRISSNKYSEKLTASGVASRWNKNDQFVIYTGASRSLATLELIVHKSSIKPVLDYKVMVISIADDIDLVKTIPEKELPDGWREMRFYNHLQALGSEWYTKNETLVLKVPSAVIPKEFNYIVNAKHPEFKPSKVKLVFQENYFWDNRLLREPLAVSH
jgi:RES domain-containing protein